VGKCGAVGATLERIGGFLPDRPALETGEPLKRVLRPTDRFAKLTITHDVDAGLRLFTHDIADRRCQARLVGLLVVRLAALPGAQEFLQRLWTNQASDVGREYATAAAFHARSMPPARPKGKPWSVAQRASCPRLSRASTSSQH